MQEFRRGRHSVSLLTVHLVCVTKYRRRIFDGAALNWLAGHFREVCETMDCRLIASDGETDHVHMLVEYPPKVSVSAFVNILNGTSSRMLETGTARYCSPLLQGHPLVALVLGRFDGRRDT